MSIVRPDTGFLRFLWNARMYMPSLLSHIVQSANNREAYFIEPENYQFYLKLWQELLRRYDVAMHTYCVMTSHIHFLVMPYTKESSPIPWT
jgi:putative transposase